MPTFTMTATCRAPAEEVFKLLWDPNRFPDWWAGMARVETGADGEVTRYMAEWPDFAYPTTVRCGREGSRVTISCLLSDIAQEWTLEPHPEGCEVRVRVDVPDAEAARTDAQRAEVGASLDRLVTLAEAESAPAEVGA